MRESAGISRVPPNLFGAMKKYLSPFFTVATSARTAPDSFATRTSGHFKSVFLILTGPAGLAKPLNSQLDILKRMITRSAMLPEPFPQTLQPA